MADQQRSLLTVEEQQQVEDGARLSLAAVLPLFDDPAQAYSDTVKKKILEQVLERDVFRPLQRSQRFYGSYNERSSVLGLGLEEQKFSAAPYAQALDGLGNIAYQLTLSLLETGFLMFYQDTTNTWTNFFKASNRVTLRGDWLTLYFKKQEDVWILSYEALTTIPEEVLFELNDFLQEFNSSETIQSALRLAIFSYDEDLAPKPLKSILKFVATLIDPSLTWEVLIPQKRANSHWYWFPINDGSSYVRAPAQVYRCGPSTGYHIVADRLEPAKEEGGAYVAPVEDVTALELEERILEFV